jgi:hypothetical protein
MDAKRFDQLTQTLGAGLSRRGALRVALGTTVLGSLGLSRPDVAEAAKCKRKPGVCEICKKGKKSKSGKRKPGKIKAKADTTPCSVGGAAGQCSAGSCIVQGAPLPPEPQPTCLGLGVPCAAAPGTCCAGTTCGHAVGATESKCCNPAGTPCSTGTGGTAGRCCTTLCNDTTNQCFCKDSTEACDDDSQCCSGTCSTATERRCT